MSAIAEFTRSLENQLDPGDVVKVEKAYECAYKAHDGQYRRSGDPYIIHPIAVTKILAGLNMDAQTLMAAMLHDVIEDTEITKADIASEFGDVVADLVDGVSKLTQIETHSKKEEQAANFQKMALAMSKDVRVILVKLADRLHNMRTLGPLSHEKRRRIATETLEIYAPIAQRLGINSIQVELEELGFKALYPMRAKYIGKAVQNVRGNHTEFLSQIKAEFEDTFKTRGIEVEVMGREKHLNSIYRKMKDRKRSFHEIMDVYAFRIITRSEDDCYRALGAVHSMYKPLPYRFKDYIAMPKSNGYQSLHTTLFGRHVNIEIQIRTKSMDEIANFGIAAHWLYKDESLLGTANADRVNRWLKNLMELREQTDDSLDFIEHVKIDLFPDEVYVFTPKGDIHELPSAATPIDFAYTIHTDVGNACIACRINKRLAPLSEPLKSGDTVEIITAPGAKPQRAWLGFVQTSKAKSSIRHFLRQQSLSEDLELGRDLIEKAALGTGHTLEQADQDVLDALLEKHHLKDMDALFKAVATGQIMPHAVIGKLFPVSSETEAHQNETDKETVMIKGTEGMKISFSHCCHPIPGDPIVGAMHQQLGLVIHAEQCKKLLNYESAQPMMHLSWVKDITDYFVVELRVELERERGIIAELALAISRAEANVDSISVQEQDAKLSTIRVLITVQGRRHLARVLRRIRSLRNFVGVSRIIS